MIQTSILGLMIILNKIIKNEDLIKFFIFIYLIEIIVI
jgi:hypothetical protein